MNYKIEFIEDGRKRYAFRDATGSNDAGGQLKKILSDREIVITGCFLAEPPPLSKPSDRLKPFNRIVKSETRVGLNDG